MRYIVLVIMSLAGLKQCTSVAFAAEVPKRGFAICADLDRQARLVAESDPDAFDMDNLADTGTFEYLCDGEPYNAAVGRICRGARVFECTK